MAKATVVWLDTQQMAELAGLPARTARYALSRAAKGFSWRGHPLTLREVRGRGGRSGLAYEVTLSSLLEALEQPLDIERLRPPTVRPPPRDIASTVPQAPVRTARKTAILPFYYLPPGSAERAAAVAAQAKATGYSVRSLNRWAAMYHAYGANGLANRKPSNAGQRRVQVSRAYDAAFRAAGYQDDLLPAIARETAQTIKGLWASARRASGRNAVKRDAETLLEELSERQGVKLPKAAYQLSTRCVLDFVDYREVHVFRNDRKRWDDNKPRVRRDWTKLSPMEVVVADVKPLDIIVRRPDGSTAWPRLIGFHDAATFRLFGQVVLCNPGEGIRQEHVHEAFIAMTMHSEWGFPQALYLDNGSEFGGLDKLRDAMALIAEPGARTIIHARPYNASAKPIKSNFARLDKGWICTLPGYAGKDRMTKKVQTVGKPPAPYPHSPERFREDIQLGIDDLNHRALTPRQWCGRSPAKVWRDHVDAGWRPVAVEAQVIDAALCDYETRQVGQGRSIRLDGRSYPVPGLPHGATVTIARSWRSGADPLYRAPGSAEWLPLVEDLALPASWRDGAPESGRRLKQATRAVRLLERDAPAIDPAEPSKARARRRVAGFVPSAGVAIDMGEQVAAVAAGQAGAKAGRRRELTEAERERIARDRETEGLKRDKELRRRISGAA